MVAQQIRCFIARRGLEKPPVDLFQKLAPPRRNRLDEQPAGLRPVLQFVGFASLGRQVADQGLGFLLEALVGGPLAPNKSGRGLEVVLVAVENLLEQLRGLAIFALGNAVVRQRHPLLHGPFGRQEYGVGQNCPTSDNTPRGEHNNH